VLFYPPLVKRSDRWSGKQVGNHLLQFTSITKNKQALVCLAKWREKKKIKKKTALGCGCFQQPNTPFIGNWTKPNGVPYRFTKKTTASLLIHS